MTDWLASGLIGTVPTALTARSDSSLLLANSIGLSSDGTLLWENTTELLSPSGTAYDNLALGLSDNFATHASCSSGTATAAEGISTLCVPNADLTLSAVSVSDGTGHAFIPVSTTGCGSETSLQAANIFACLSPDGSTAAFALANNTVSLSRSSNSFASITTNFALRSGAIPLSITFDSTGTSLWVSYVNSASIDQYNLTGTLLQTFSVGSTSPSYNFMRVSGSSLVITSKTDNKIFVVNLATPAISATINLNTIAPNELVIASSAGYALGLDSNDSHYKIVRFTLDGANVADLDTGLTAACGGLAVNSSETHAYTVSGGSPAVTHDFVLATGVIPSGVAYVAGQRVSVPQSSYDYPPSSDTYQFLQTDGTSHFDSIANGGAQPTDTGLLISKTVTDSLGVTSITQLAPAAPTIVGQAHSGANSDITSLSGLTTPLPVSEGGTGNNTLNSHGVMLGNGTGTVNVTQTGAAGQVLTSNGTGTDPTFRDTVSSVSSGNLSPIFTSSVANPTTTPSISYSLSQFPAHAYLGNNTSASATPSAVQPSFSDIAGTAAAAQLPSDVVRNDINNTFSGSNTFTGTNTQDFSASGQTVRVPTKTDPASPTTSEVWLSGSTGTSLKFQDNATTPATHTIADSTNSVTAGAGLSGGGYITSNPTISLSVPVIVANGGTGATDATTARSNLAAAASGANSDITSLSGLTTALPLSEGGTGATTAAAARSNLGAATSGANSDITSITGLTTPLAVGQGGTGNSTLTAHGVLVGNGTSAANVTSAGTAGQVLTSNGSSADPTWQDTGSVTSVSSGNLSPIFTSAVANPSTTPSISYSLSQFPAHSFLGNSSSSSAVPSAVQPGFGDISGTLGSSQLPSDAVRTDAGNIYSGTYTQDFSASTQTLKLPTKSNSSPTASEVWLSGSTGTSLMFQDHATTPATHTIADNTNSVTAGTGLSGGGSITSNPTISLSVPVTVANGGTGASNAIAARSNLDAAASGANSDITSLTGLTTALPLSEGGTDASTAGGARSNLGAAASGANSDITSLTGLTTALPLSEGGTGAATAATARANLGAAASGANSDITSLSALTTPLSVAQGGTGNSTLTAHGVLLGNGTSAVTVTQSGTTGQVLTSNGSGADPTWQNAGNVSPPHTTSVSQVAVPGVPTLTSVGNSGSSSYEYAIVARDATGNASPSGLAKQITNASNLLNSSNYNTISWNAVPGAASYDVYRLPSQIATSNLNVGASPYAVATTPDGTKAYICDNSWTVSVIDTSTNSITATVTVGSQAQALAITPDSSKVYVANYADGTVSVINTATNSVAATISVGKQPDAVAVTPDGSQVYVANYGSQSVSVISTATNQVSATINVGSEPDAVSITPDGTKVYVANKGSDTVSVIDTSTNTRAATINVGTWPEALATTPDSNHVYVANSVSNSVSVIDTSTNTVSATVSVDSEPKALAITPDGTKVYVVNYIGFDVSVIQTSTNTVIATVSTGFASYPQAVAITPDGTQALVANYDAGTVTAIATSGNTIIATINTGNTRLNAIAVTPNGAQAYVCDTTGTVPVISVSTDTLSSTVSIGSGLKAAAATSDSSKVYICNDPGTISVLDASSNIVTATIAVGSNPKAIQLTPNGSKAYVANSGSASVSVIDTSTDSVSATVAVGSSPQAIAITPDGTKAYVANYADGTVSDISTATDTVSRTVTVGSEPDAVAITPDGSKVYVVNLGSNTVSVIDTSSDTVSATISVGSGPTSIAITPNGAQAYVVNYNAGTVSAINTSTNSVASTITVGTWPQPPAMTPDGAKVFIANQASDTVSVISTAGNTVLTNIAMGNQPLAVAIAPDGTKAYVALNVGGLEIISVANDTIAGQLSANGSTILTLTPDGTRAYASGYQQVSVVSLPSPALIGKIANATSTSYNDQYLWNGDGSYPPAATINTVTMAASSSSEQLLDCTNGNIVVYLPDATASNGKQFSFKRIDHTNNVATIIGYNNQLVYGNQPRWTLYNQANPLSIESDGTATWRSMSTSSSSSWAVAALPSKKIRGTTDWAMHDMLVQGTDGKLYGWGQTTNGNLAGGITSGNQIASPVVFDPNNPPASGTYIVDWAATGSNLFVVLSDGTVYGAGDNVTGQLGLGNTTSNAYLQKIPFFNGIPVTKVWAFDLGGIAPGDGKTFFLTSTGALYACGYNATYELGLGNNTSPIETPTLVSNITNPAQIKSAHAYGGGFTLICDATGALYVTGYNPNGQLGTGSAAEVTSFTQVTIPGAAPIVNVYAYGCNANSAPVGFAAALDANGSLFMAGYNGFGVLGQGNTNANTTYGWFKLGSTAAYNTGTVSASGTAVTGTSTSWTSIPATTTSLQIGFGSTNPANITTWYPISSIGSATSLTLVSSAGTVPSGTSYVITAIPIPNPIVDFAWTGDSTVVGCIALDGTGGVWTWGFNGQNNLFYANTATQAAPTKVASNGKIVSANNTTAYANAINPVFWDGSKLHIGGTVADGFVGITDSSFASGSVAVSLPQSITTGAESVTDIFVNNFNSSGRLFILTDHGNLYAGGDNTNGVSTSGIAGPASVGLYKVGLK